MLLAPIPTTALPLFGVDVPISAVLALAAPYAALLTAYLVFPGASAPRPGGLADGALERADGEAGPSRGSQTPRLHLAHHPCGVDAEDGDGRDRVGPNLPGTGHEGA